MNRIRLTAVIFILAARIFVPLPAVSQNWVTPFEASNGIATPRYDTTIAFFDRLDKASNIIALKAFGIPSPMGRKLYMVIADKDGLQSPEAIRESGRMIVLVQACIHPGESEGKDAGMLLLRDMAIKHEHLDLLDSCSLVFIPVYNVDGHERFGPYNRINQNGPVEMGWRTTANNLNLNRDYLKADAPETISWLSLWNEWDFDFFVDIHTTDGADYKYVVTYQMEIHGNMERHLSEWSSENFIPLFEQGMNEANVPTFQYITFRRWTDPLSGMSVWVSPPRLSQGYAALCNRPGLLIETHMLKDYKTRVEGTYESIVQTLSILMHQKQVLEDLERKADIFTATQEFRQTPYPLKFRTADVSHKTMIEGYEFEKINSTVTGGSYYRYSDRPKQIVLDYYDEVEIVRSVRLPSYYIVPPQYQELRERLDAHHIEYRILDHGDTMDVVMSRLSNPKWSRSPYEGRFTVETTEDTFSTERYFPKGSLIISMSQRKAPVITHILEPSAPDSYVYWGFFNNIFEQKEYAEDYVIEPMAQKMLANNPTLKKEFEELMKNPEFASNQRAILNWFYMQTPYWDQEKDLYPVGRVFDASSLSH